MNKFICFVLVLWVNISWAQRNVDFVIPFVQGGTADRVAQLLLPHMKEELAPLGINPTLIYRPGASALLAAGIVARTDRLQILLAPNTVITATLINPAGTSINIVTDLVPLVYIGQAPMMLAVNAKSPWKTLGDFQRDCQRRTVTYGSAGIGSISHIATSMLMTYLGCKNMHVPYKGAGQVHVDLLGSHIDFSVDFISSLQNYFDTGMFRPLLSVDLSRNKDHATVPSLTDIGYRDYEFYYWQTLAVSAKIPFAESQALKGALEKTLQRVELRNQLHEAGFVKVGQRIKEDFFASEMHKLEKIISRVSIDAK